MLNKFKNIAKSDNFSYFIRYFAVFTLIFAMMTMIILQVMRGTMYRSSDENFKGFRNDPDLIIKFALARGIYSDAEIIIEPPQTANSTSQSNESKKNQKTKEEFKPSKLRLNTNYQVLLYDKNGRMISQVDTLSGLSTIEVDTDKLGEITEKTVTTAFGEDESYRTMTMDISKDESVLNSNYNIQYATVVFNTSQIKFAISQYDSTVILVMISFWLISIFASIYLAKLSLRPLLISFQKQKDFVENASHELRTPLSVLQNRLESLFRKPEATIMESSEKIASSLEEVRNMRLLTTNLMNLARRDDGLKIEISEIPSSFFDETVENFAIIADENEKMFTANNAIHQPIFSDKTLLKQVMTILFDNALKYTEDGGQIQIHLEIRDKQFVFSVADNGLGISDADKGKIFDRFYRVDKARTRQKGGFGLGLSLAKQILDSLHGTIQVKDNHPKGSIFEVHIPIKNK